MNYFGVISQVFSAMLGWVNSLFSNSLGVSFVGVVAVGCVWIALLGFIFRIRLPGISSEPVETEEETYERVRSEKATRSLLNHPKGGL